MSGALVFSAGALKRDATSARKQPGSVDLSLVSLALTHTVRISR